MTDDFFPRHPRTGRIEWHFYVVRFVCFDGWVLAGAVLAIYTIVRWWFG